MFFNELERIQNLSSERLTLFFPQHRSLQVFGQRSQLVNLKNHEKRYCRTHLTIELIIQISRSQAVKMSPHKNFHALAPSP
jgi:hypothetical protein